MMKNGFSRRMSGLQPSRIREMLKSASVPGAIPFAAGNPSQECFPVTEMAALAEELFANHAASALQYGISEGYTPLRELTAERLRQRHKSGSSSDELLITSGGQQGIELAAKILCNEGDAVVCENPSFIGALNAFRSYGLPLIGVPLDAQGMDPDALRRVLENNPHVKMIYTIPTFQNPSGTVMNAERRHALLALAEEFDVFILEDSPYVELRYSGVETPTLKSLDTAGRVIYCGSYSKIIAPGIRIGFVCAHKDIIGKMTVAKQVSDVHSNLFFQMLIAGFIEKYDLDAHIARCIELYRRKRDILADALGQAFGSRLRLVLPEGGLFLWFSLEGIEDSIPFCERAKEKNAMAVPGVSFLVDESQRSDGMRLNFSLPSEAQLRRGAGLLGEVLHSF